jgi:hypothetical protein
LTAELVIATLCWVRCSSPLTRLTCAKQRPKGANRQLAEVSVARLKSQSCARKQRKIRAFNIPI